MAVITKYIIVRNGVELGQVFDDKKDAEIYDKMLDAADSLAELIKESGLISDEKIIEELSVFLAKRGPEVSAVLKGVKPFSDSAGKSGKDKKPKKSAKTDAETQKGSGKDKDR